MRFGQTRRVCPTIVGKAKNRQWVRTKFISVQEEVSANDLISPTVCKQLLGSKISKGQKDIQVIIVFSCF